MSYPTLMYRCPGPHFAHDGQTYEYMSVDDEDALKERLQAGWSVTLLQAVAVAKAPAEPVREPEPDAQEVDRAELENMANDLGIKFDGRTTDAALLRKIEAAAGGE